MIASRLQLSATFTVLLTALLGGCSTGEAVDPEVQTLRQQLLVDQPPADPAAVDELRKQLQQPDAPESIPVVVRGRINAGDIPPWEPGKAAFVLTDATGHADDDDHDPHECPFCSRNIETMIAHVQFRDKSDHVIEVDAQKLFDVTEDQLVIVSGRGSLDESGILIIAASNLFVSR